ncbi:hypothetical protein [Phaeodactylibacter xiamenensis]|uniref:hypothetical protein n=1 Tax=Phaeodactylibacter xiamenensis TaxID=1524460 RepID=UPI003CCC15AB
MNHLYFNAFNVMPNYREIMKNFTILRMRRRGEHRLSYRVIGDFLDALPDPFQGVLQSACFMWENEAFLLFRTSDLPKSGYLGRLTETGQSFDCLIAPVQPQQIKRKHKLFQLFLNAAPNSARHRYRYHNVTGRLFITSADRDFVNKADQSRIAMEVEVKPDFTIQLHTRTFTSLSRHEDLSRDKYCRPSEKERKKLWSKEQFLFDPATDRFKRYSKVLDGDVPLKDRYVNRRPKCARLIKGKKKKNRIDFFSLNPKKYGTTKIALFNELYFEAFLPKFRNYFDVQQVCRPETAVESVQFEKSAADRTDVLRNVPVRLINNTIDAKAEQQFKAALREHFGLSARSTRHADPGAINFVMNNDIEHYQRHKEDKDRYEQFKATPECATQQFTRQEFKGAGNSKAFIAKLVTELHLKYDIARSQMTVFDWGRLQASGTWSFVLKEEEDQQEPVFHFLSIHPDGQMKFSSLTRDLFTEGFHSKLTAIFDKHPRGGQSIEGVILDDGGNLNVIQQTGRRAFPNLEGIHKEIMAGIEIEGVEVPADDVKSFTAQYLNTNGSETALPDLQQYLAGVQTGQTVALTELKRCIHGKSPVKSDYAKAFHRAFGYWLKHPFKSKEATDRYSKALVDLHTYEEGGALYYWANTRMKETKGQFPNGNVVRKLKPVDNSRLLSDFLLETLAVNFVRINAPTVLPFPFKLLREYAKMAEKPDSSTLPDLSQISFD